MHRSRRFGSASRVGLALALALGGCGGEAPGKAAPPAGKGGAAEPDALTSTDPAVAGPALHAHVRRALEARDAKALLDLLSEDMRAEGLEHIQRVRADLEKDPEQVKRVQQALGLTKSPLELAPEEMLELEVAQRLKDPEMLARMDKFGHELIESKALGERLLLRARAEPAQARDIPGGIAETVFVRQGGRWRLDEKATNLQVSGWTRTLPLPEGNADHLDFTPDGRFLVMSGSHGVHLVPFEGGGGALHVRTPWAGTAHVDPGGAWLLTVSEGGPLPRLDRGEPISEAESVPEGAPAPPPDPHRGVVLWSLPGGERLRLVREEPVWARAVSPSGKRLAFVHHTDQGVRVVVVSLPDGTQAASVDMGDVRVLAFAGEDALAVQGDELEVRIHGLDGKRRLTVPTAKVESPLHLACDGAGTRLAVLGTTVTKGLTERHVALYDLTEGEELWRVEPGWSDRVRFSPNGSEVAAGEVLLKRYDAATGALTGVHLSTPERHTGAFAWHPSGRWLVCAGRVESEIRDGVRVKPAPWVAHVYALKR